MSNRKLLFFDDQKPSLKKIVDKVILEDSNPENEDYGQTPKNRAKNDKTKSWNAQNTRKMTKKSLISHLSSVLRMKDPELSNDTQKIQHEPSFDSQESQQKFHLKTVGENGGQPSAHLRSEDRINPLIEQSNQTSKGQLTIVKPTIFTFQG